MQLLSTAARLALLAAVLAGLFGMHVLTAEDGSSGHGALPMIGTSGHPDMTVPARRPADPTPAVKDAVGTLPGIAAELSADPGAGGVDHGAMAGCILFLVVGGAALILLLLRLREGPGRRAWAGSPGSRSPICVGAVHPAGGHGLPCA